MAQQKPEILQINYKNTALFSAALTPKQQEQRSQSVLL